MGARATFDYQKWLARYPEFEGVDGDLAKAYFDEATIYLANDGSGPVQSADRQLMLLNMLTAHIAMMNRGANGQSPSGLVGPVQSASQGSVSVSVAVGPQPASAAWYMTTTYGAAFWRATASYRTARYVPGLQRQFL